MRLSSLERDILHLSLDEQSGVWMVASVVEAHLPDASADELRQITISSIRSLLHAGLMRPGNLLESGFAPWESDPDESADRIDFAWKSLGRVPNSTESAWFELTKAGRK